jgi:site-specific DNA recombinase
MNQNNPTGPKLRGAAYIRYSSEMQAESFSLDAQLRQIQAKATSDGVEIIHVYADPAISAYSKRYRPGIVEMLDGAQKQQFDVLYVHKVDRLARRLEWSIEILNKLRSFGVGLKAVEQNFDLDAPEGKLMFHVLGSLGEFYSDNLSKETHKGKYERAQQGYHNGWVPWGYKSELAGSRMLAVPDPERAGVIPQIFERYATGHY